MKRVQCIINISIILLFLSSSLIAQKRYDQKVGINKAKITQTEKIEFGSAAAYSDGEGILIKWKTKVEKGNVGFFIYKIVGGEKILVNDFLVGGGYLTNDKETVFDGNYSYFDERGSFGATYFIESYSVTGKRSTSEYIFPEFVSKNNLTRRENAENIQTNLFKRNNIFTDEKITWSKQLTEDVGENALEADLSRQKWVAAQPGVKIGVKKEGFYRVLRAELQAAGFDVNTPSANWQLYVNGVEQTIIVEPNGNHIEFYGKGINTLESNTQIYFLVAGNSVGKRIERKIQRRISANVFSKDYNQTFSKEERAVYVPNILNGERTNFFGTLVNSDGGTINFNLTGIDFHSEKANVEINVQGLSLASHTININLNGNDLGTLTGSFRQLATKNLTVPTIFLKEGANTLKLTAVEGTGDLSLFDSISIDFARVYQANQNGLSFYTDNYRAARLQGFSSANVRVFDISYPDSPVLYTNLQAEQTNNSYGLTIPGNRSRLFFAVGDEGLLKADTITQNKPSTLSNAAHNADLVIISYDKWLTQANAWADYRRADGLSAEVVSIDDVFDEFN